MTLNPKLKERKVSKVDLLIFALSFYCEEPMPLHSIEQTIRLIFDIKKFQETFFETVGAETALSTRCPHDSFYHLQRIKRGVFGENDPVT